MLINNRLHYHRTIGGSRESVSVKVWGDQHSVPPQDSIIGCNQYSQSADVFLHRVLACLCRPITPNEYQRCLFASHPTQTGRPSLQDTMWLFCHRQLQHHHFLEFAEDLRWNSRCDRGPARSSDHRSFCLQLPHNTDLLNLLCSVFFRRSIRAVRVQEAKLLQGANRQVVFPGLNSGTRAASPQARTCGRVRQSLPTLDITSSPPMVEADCCWDSSR